MKVKKLMGVFLIVLILLVYNLFCYKLVNNIIEKDTKMIITNYLNTEEKIKFLKITYKDSYYNICVKEKDNYYNFILDTNYKIVDVNKKVPLYIR